MNKDDLFPVFEQLGIHTEEIHFKKVKFISADISKSWDFVNQEKFDLATFSFLLEHIENLNSVFEKLDKVISTNGYVYLIDLQTYKQYSGSKARFETQPGIQALPCFTNHLSDYDNAAKKMVFGLFR